MSVAYLSNASKDGTRWTVDQMLDSVSNEMKKKEDKPTKALLVLLDDNDDRYDVSLRQAGLTMSQAIAMTDVAMSMMRKEMGY